MKLVRLDLLAFGSLHGISLDLASAEPCLHLVYGANEAGKSTALRALQGLFYGIPENTPDAHRFKAGELRVGALLCDARGREQYVVRRKGRKHTLASRDGSPLHGPDVSWISAGVSETQFRSLFALGYDTLEEGADELLGAAGELGESLFTAGTGGAGAHSVLEALQREADAIYRPRGRNQRLNEVLLAFDQAKRNVREQAIRAEAYTEQQRAIGEAEAEVGRWQRERQQLTAERVRLERARRVLPLFARRAEYQRERAALGDVVLLPETAGEDRRRITRASRDANLRIEHVQRELEKLEQAIEALPIDAAWLAPAHAARLGELRDRLLQYRRARRALPARREALERAAAEVQAMLERLGLHTAEGTLETLRISRPLEAKIREQARLGENLRRRCSELQRQLSAKRDLLMRQSRMLAQLRGAALPEPDEAEAAGREEDVQIALPLSEPPPPLRLERTDEFEHALSELAQERRLCAGKQEDEEQALARITCELDALAQAGEPPTEPQLAAAREARRDLSAELRENLSKERIGKAKALLERLDEQSAQADALADRLRREAARVAEYSRLRAAESACLRQLERLRERAAELTTRERELNGRWLAVCAAAGVAPRPPGAMRGFLAEYRAEAARLEQLDREAGALLRELEAERTEYAGWQAGWGELAAKLGHVRVTSVAEVEAVLLGLNDVFARADASQRDAREIDALGRECEQFEAELSELAARLVPELGALAAVPLAEALLERYAAAQSGADKRAALSQQCEARRAELIQAQAVLRDAELELDALVAAARVADASGLEPAEEAARRARGLDAALAQLHLDLLAAADGCEPAQLEGELAGVVLPELQLRLQELDDNLERVELERDRALHTLEARRAGLSLLRDSRGAADSALEAGAQLENARLLAERYVRVRLAHGVLAREVERYRERHTGPILRNASSLFEELTGGAWSRLEADLDEQDKPVLMCVRSDGDRVGVAGLSAGTRDQLYLALRLASLEQLGTGRELLPLVLDDLLVHFDDDRARAALRVLGAFARGTTQVLLFTHHSKVCDLAREVLSADHLRIHRLTPQAHAELELSLAE
jgi:uncharacterized protein YhaN